jgi:hypothetical protein
MPRRSFLALALLRPKKEMVVKKEEPHSPPCGRLYLGC